jgi:hypothetical protein
MEQNRHHQLLLKPALTAHLSANFVNKGLRSKIIRAVTFSLKLSGEQKLGV